jgi:hypothetical protein
MMVSLTRLVRINMDLLLVTLNHLGYKNSIFGLVFSMQASRQGARDWAF